MRDRIIKAMREKGINSMAELERRAGIPTGTMRNAGQGHMPSMDKIKKICNLLGVTVDWILYGDEEVSDDTTRDRDNKKESAIPAVENADPVREFARMVYLLNDQNMQSLLDYLRYLLSRQERD